MSYTSGIDSQQATNAATPSRTQSTEAVNTPTSVTNRYEALSTNLPHTDETALSSTADLIYKSLGASDARTAKVSSLQEAIAPGSYSVSSSDVADKIIQSLLK
jgi:negative regulator of flagellin synthesis FlgM